MKNLIKICFSALFFLSLVSCGTYKFQSNSNRIESVLAVTTAGDTIQVPINKIVNEYYTGRYNGWQFRWYDNWFNYYSFPYYFYRDYNGWNRSPIYYSTPSRPQIQLPLGRPRVKVKGRRGSNNIERNDQINRPNFRTPRPTEGGNNGRRGRSREVIPSQPTRPKVTPPSQPGQIRRGSTTPRVQQPVPRSSSADQEAEDLSNNKETFVWDTTASNPKKVKELKDKGYDIYMVMVYTHPMISYISNFSRKRNIPSAAVFSTWRNVYQLISDYDKITNGNLSIFISDRGGKYKNEVDAFNLASKNGPTGIKDYLQKYNEKNGIEGSTFRKPIEMSQQEEEEFLKATQGVDWDKDSYGEDRAIKDAFLKAYQKNGTGPGADKLRDAVVKYRERKAKQEQREDEVLENIA